MKDSLSGVTAKECSGSGIPHRPTSKRLQFLGSHSAIAVGELSRRLGLLHAQVLLALTSTRDGEFVIQIACSQCLIDLVGKRKPKQGFDDVFRNSLFVASNALVAMCGK